MYSANLKTSSVAAPWKSILAVSLENSFPIALCSSCRLLAFHRRVSPTRGLSFATKDTRFSTEAVPSVAEGWLWQRSDATGGPVFGRHMSTKVAGSPKTAAGESDAKSQDEKAAENESAEGNGMAADSSGPLLSGAESNGNTVGSSPRAPFEQLRFRAAAACIPHPDKAAKGGEDAHFIADDGLAFGVADGVGSWGEIAVDAGIYSRMLMDNAKKAAEQAAPGTDTPQLVLTQAYQHTSAKGSSTACIVMLDGSMLRASNLGDSGFLVLRNSQIVFQSPQQQHQFNFPYQLGGPESRGDSPNVAERFEVGLQQGDVVVAATDGLIDNVFPQETASLVSVIHRRGDPPKVAAAGLAQYAKFRAEDEQHLSPFAYGAQKAGYRYMGGKVDDITVVVAYVQAASEL